MSEGPSTIFARMCRSVNVCLSETWLRRQQVLPARTHPDVNMSGSGGYVLSGTYVDPAEPEEANGNEDDGGGKRPKKE